MVMGSIPGYDDPQTQRIHLNSTDWASKWPVAIKRSQYDVAASDSGDKYLKRHLCCLGTTERWTAIDSNVKTNELAK